MVFQVGDRVLITKPGDVSESPAWVNQMDVFDDTIQVVAEVHDSILMEGAGGWSYNPNWLSIVGHKSCGAEGPVTIKSEEKITMAVFNKVALDANTRMARQAILECEDGSLTQKGQDVVVEFLYLERREEILKAYQVARKTLANDEKTTSESLVADKTE